MPETTITTYEGTLSLDGESKAVTVDVPGLAHEHERDAGAVRRKLRDVLATARKMHPEAKSLSLTVRIRGGTDVREELTP